MLLALLAAAPLCFGGEGGCTPYRAAYLPERVCFAWYQAGLYDWESVGVCSRYEALRSDEAGSFLGIFLGSKADRASLFNAQVTRPLEPIEVETLNQLLDPLPPPLYVVKAYFTGSRPTYPYIDGKRLTKSNGRINVGSPCDCSVHDGEYCLVKPATVAVCSRQF